MTEQEKMPDKDKQLAEVTEQAKKWEGLYTETTIKRALLDAAERGGAYHAPQLLPFLTKDAKMEEVKGQHVVYVQGSDDSGKKIRRTPDEAVANMKKQGDFANLFKDTMTAKPTLGTPSKIDLEKLLKNMPHEQFLKLRAEKPEIFGLGPLPKRR
jgi:hypothetical protein